MEKLSKEDCDCNVNDSLAMLKQEIKNNGIKMTAFVQQTLQLAQKKLMAINNAGLTEGEREKLTVDLQLFVEERNKIAENNMIQYKEKLLQMKSMLETKSVITKL